MTKINAKTIINEAMAALAVAPEKTDSDFFDKIKIKTSERGYQLVQNNKSNIQKFIDLVRKNAAAFGGGLVRNAKPRPSVTWPANLVALFKQSIEDHDYRAALDIGDRLGALFYTSSKGNVFMQVAPVPCGFSDRVVSVCNEDGKFSVIDPASMRALTGLTIIQKRTRAAQVENVRLKLESMPSFDLDAALDKQSAFEVDQSLLRAQWILEHGLDSEAIEVRIDANNAQIEEQASQDVAQVVAQALATIAITEAMADASKDARELVTCEAGESEASAPTAGRISWAPVPQYVPPSLSQIKPGEPVPPAYRGGMDDTAPPSGGNAEDATPVAVSSAPLHPRRFVPDNGLHYVEDAFEAWTFQHKKSGRYCFVMYLGRQSKSHAHYGYPTEAKRDEGFLRHVSEVREMAAIKAKRKADSKAQADKPHDLQVGDVVRSSWGYDQTNVNHYQVTAVIGKRTVEVRELSGIVERDSGMSGDVAPVWGEFKGEPMRRQVDQHGAVNMLHQTFGRAYKIEPLAIVHGVRCYAASSYSSYA